MFKLKFLVNTLSMKMKVLLTFFIALLVLFAILRDNSQPLNALYLQEYPKEEFIYAYSNFNLESYYSCGKLKIIHGNNVVELVDITNQDVLGEGLVFDSLDINEFEKVNNLKLVSKEKVGGIQIYNYYSFLMPKYVVLNNQRVNVQIAICDGYYKLGYPLILDSY